MRPLMLSYVAVFKGEAVVIEVWMLWVYISVLTSCQSVSEQNEITDNKLKCPQGLLPEM